MRCGACLSPTDPIPSLPGWDACRVCGSETNTAAYLPDDYGAGYVAELLAAEGADPAANHQHTADWVERHDPGKPGGLVLDVGCGAGTTLAVLRSRGWAAVGWDVSAAGRPPGTVVSQEFRADLFRRPFDAVACREVLEHAPDPHRLLRELAAAVAPGGVLHLTTPRPIADKTEWRVYQPLHLCVWSPLALRAALVSAGFESLEFEEWELGQRIVCGRA